MAPALTVQDLRGLARLHRDGVDGAGEQLAAIIDDHIDELPGLLGFRPENLERLRSADDPVALLVATITGAQRLARETHHRDTAEEARRVAAEITAGAVVDDDGDVVLVAEPLYRALRLWPGTGMLVFGDRGGVELGRLRAVMRACVGVLALSVLIRDDHVIVAYATVRSRGVVRLALQPVRDHLDALVVDLPPAHAAPTMREVALEASAATGEPPNASDGIVVAAPTLAAPRASVRPRRAGQISRARRFVISGLVDALASALTGALR